MKIKFIMAIKRELSQSVVHGDFSMKVSFSQFGIGRCCADKEVPPRKFLDLNDAASIHIRHNLQLIL